MVLADLKLDDECTFDSLYWYQSFFEDCRFGFLSIKNEDRAKITEVKTELEDHRNRRLIYDAAHSLFIILVIHFSNLYDLSGTRTHNLQISSYS